MRKAISHQLSAFRLIIFSLFTFIFLLLASCFLLHTPTFASSEENAVYNLNQGTLPKEVIPTPSTNFFSQIFGFLTKIINPPKLFAQSETIHQANLPEEVKPKNKDPLERVKGLLGTSTGFYGVDLPSDICDTNNSTPFVTNYERCYEQANFPEGIKPITGN